MWMLLVSGIQTACLIGQCRFSAMHVQKTSKAHMPHSLSLCVRKFMVTVTDDLTHQMRISNFRFHFCTPNVLVFTACEPIQFPFIASSNGGYRRYPVLFCNWNRGGWHFNDVRRFRSSFAYYLNGIWSLFFLLEILSIVFLVRRVFFEKKNRFLGKFWKILLKKIQ